MEAIANEWMEHWEGLYDTLEEAANEAMFFQSLDVDEAYEDLEKDISYVNTDFLKPTSETTKESLEQAYGEGITDLAITQANN